MCLGLCFPLSGLSVCLAGTPSATFWVDFLKPNGEVPFHFSVRFMHQYGYERALFNSLMSGHWGYEEYAPSFPFVLHRSLSLRFTLTAPDTVAVELDGLTLAAFTRHVGFTDVTHVQVNADITLETMNTWCMA